MAFLLSNYSSALKEVILPYIKDNYPKDKILVDQMKRNAGVTFINDEFIAPVRSSRHGGIASMATDDANVVSSSGASYTRGTVSVKRHSGAFDISDLVMKASASSKGAVESALQAQTRSLTDDWGRFVNRMLYSDGIGVVSQALGSVGAGTASLMYPDANLDDGRSIDWYGTINNDIKVDKYLAVGNILAIGTGGVDLGTVTSVTGTSVVMTGSPAIVASDSIYVADGSGGGAGSAEIEGIRAALSSSTGTSTYAGLARSTVGWTPSFGSASEALSLTRMENAYLSAREYGAAGDAIIILANKTLYRKYGDILTAMRRTVNSADLLGGFKGLEFAAGDGNVGVFLDYDVPDGELLVLNLDTWTLCQVEEMDWLSGGDGEPLLRLQSTTKYQATLVWYANALCLAPAANARETRKTA
ncbi:MAG: phage major capsid protein [Patescibacteria group bacterium]